MGSWVQTCGVSGLTIRDGDEVRLFILAPHRKKFEECKTGYCYSADVYMPAYLGIKCTYDDYGQVLPHNDLNNRIVASAMGCVDTLSDKLDRITKGETGLTVMMVHEAVYRHTLVAYELQPEWYKHDVSPLGPSLSHQFDSDRALYANTMRKMGYTVLHRYVYNDGMHGPESLEVEEIRKLSIEHFKFDTMMNVYRRGYMPQTGNGSQDDNGNALVELGKIVAEINTKRNNDL